MLPVNGSRARALAAATASLMLASAPTTANDRRQTPTPSHVVWDRILSSSTQSTEFRAMASGAGGTLLVGATERDTLDPATATVNRLLLWKVDSAGQRTGETELRRSPSSRPSTTASIRDVAIDGTEAVLLVDFDAGRPSIVRVDGGGKQTTTRELVAPGRVVTLMKIVPFGGGRFAAIGHESLDALIVAVDAAGTMLWEKKQDRGKMDFFVDGVPAPGGLLLVGNSGQYDPLRSGPSSVWVGLYDPKGDQKAEVLFPGRHGRVARTGDGSYVVVYDRSDTNAQDVRVKALTADLKEAWERPVVNIPKGFSEFQIVGRNGGFIVAGVREGHIWTAWLDESGRTTTTAESDKSTSSIDVGTVGLAGGADGSVVIASSNIDAHQPPNVRQLVRLRKVAM